MTDKLHSISNWCSLVEQIGAGSESAVENLYKSLRPIRFFFIRQIGSDRAEDAYQTLMMDLVGAIKTGALREPGALFAYAMAIARRTVCRHIAESIRDRRTLDVKRMVWLTASESPEQLVLRSERQEIAKRVLTALSSRNRGILIRFYLNGESEEEIRAAMGLTHNQFRLIKSRAKARYEQLVQQSMNRPLNRPPPSASEVPTHSQTNTVVGKTKVGAAH